MKKLLSLLILSCLLLTLCLSASAAGMVTDTLTVKVGYWGMDTDRYVELGTYHWSELERDLPLHRQAYSFFRPDESGNYRIAIDSAYGFDLADLLSYVSVDQSDVLSLQFYTQDQTVGYFTSFTAQDLFGTQRYYFSDLAAHIHPVLDEDGNFVSWDASEAWGDSVLVPAMLALEDTWVWYDIGTEHTAPNYETLSTGNRFRLLFGQAGPMETRTNQTAKYTHTVYVTFQGAPTVGELPTLDSTLGSHSASFTVTVGNHAILEALASLLELRSSDESVLQITGIKVTPDEVFSDLAHVEIAYTVLSAGAAGISISLGGTALADPLPLPEPPEQPPADDLQDETEAPESEPSEEAPSIPAEAPASTAESGAAQTPQTGESDAAPLPDEPALSAPAEAPQTEPPAAIEPTGVSAIVLDAATAARLAASRNPAPADEPANNPASPLTLPEQDRSQTAILTALGALLLLLLGGGSSFIYYKREQS